MLPFDWYQRNLAQRYPDLAPAAIRPGGLTALERAVYICGWPAPVPIAYGPDAFHMTAPRSLVLCKGEI
jgi:hypothetical protein